MKPHKNHIDKIIITQNSQKSNKPLSGGTKNAFTIVELLIVVVVIAILAAIATVAYNGITNNAKVSALKNDLTTAAKKIHLDKVEQGSFPSTSPKPSYLGDTIQYTRSSDASFCITASKDGIAFHMTEAGTIQEGACSGHVIAGGGQGGGLGNAWTKHSRPLGQDTIPRIAYNGDSIVVVNGGRVMTSLDRGETWTDRSPSFTNVEPTDVTYGAGHFLVSAYSFSSGNVEVRRSTDGVVWGAPVVSIPNAFNVFSRIIFADGQFWFFGNIYDSDRDITVMEGLHSYDGLTWTQLGSVDYFNASVVTRIGGIFAASSPHGDDAAMYVSSDGVNWDRRELDLLEDEYIYDFVGAGNKLMFLVGRESESDNEDEETVSENYLLISEDGQSWTRHSQADRVLSMIVYAEGYFYGISGDNWDVLAISNDGVAWRYKTLGLAEEERVTYIFAAAGCLFRGGFTNLDPGGTNNSENHIHRSCQ